MPDQLELSGPDGETFRLEPQPLGTGGFGQVFRAVGLNSKRVVAVKLLRPFTHPLAAKALENEAALATRVKHANVVPVLHFASEGPGAPYLMTEFVEGETLAKLLQRHRNESRHIPIAEARALMLQVAEGAKAINERLIHRDIKPDNILLEGARPRITDFGISKARDEETRATSETFKGIQAIKYKAPENWLEFPNTHKMDVYSVGLVFAELLTLRHPLEEAAGDGSEREWKEAHLWGDPLSVRALRPDAPNGLARLVSRMIEKRQQDRPEWDKILGRLSETDQDTGGATRLAGALLAAEREHDEQERLQREEERATEEARRLGKTYQVSCRRLVDQLDGVIQEFNARSQVAQIQIQVGENQRRTYILNPEVRISHRFFSRGPCNIRLAGGTLIGGGYLCVERGATSKGASRNTLLISEGPEDPYGKWKLAYGHFTGFRQEEARQLHDSLRIQVEPFGIRSERVFFDHIGLAHGMNVFSFTTDEEIDSFLPDLLAAR